MAAATSTATSNGTDFEQLGIDLERQELENGASPCSATLYSQLLAIYLIQNDLCNAKFLWKRIPASVKTGATELSSIWTIGQRMWQKDYNKAYEFLQKEWSDDLKPIMAAVLEAFRQRALRLVQLAYSSIGADDLSMFVGMPTDEAIQAAQKEGWAADETLKMITPKKPDMESTATITNEHHLSVLTDYVTFMEN